MDARSSASKWPWPRELDAVIAAPDSHRLLFENDRVRVLEVVIEPGAREPEHTHRWPSVMIVERPARIRYYEQGTQTLIARQCHAAARTESHMDGRRGTPLGGEHRRLALPRATDRAARRVERPN